MKKKIIAIVMTVLMLLGTVGCSTEGLSLYEEMKKPSAWEAVESKGTVVVSVDAAGEKVNVSANFSGYVNTKEQQAYIDMQISQFEVSGIKSDVKFAPVKMYLDKKTVYISKTYFTDLFAVSGAPVPQAFANIKADYIGLDTSAVTTGQIMQITPIDQENVLKLVEKMFIGSEVKVPITQKGREYTIALDSKQMVDLSVGFLKEMMNNVDEINKISNTGFTQKDIDAQKAQFETALEQGTVMLKPIIDGSKLTLKYTFEDNKYKQNLEANIKVAFGGESVSMNIVTTSESSKIAKKAIVLPTSKVVYTMDEFMKLLMPVYAQVDAAQVITKKDAAYVPLKDTMKQLNYTVKYNAKTKKVTLAIDGKDVAVTVMTQKGVSYISLTELSKLGFNFTKDEQGVTVSR